MFCEITLTLTPEQHALIHLPGALAAHRSTAEFLIRGAARKHGYDWSEIECVVASPSGEVIERVRWEPLATSIARISASQRRGPRAPGRRGARRAVRP